MTNIRIKIWKLAPITITNENTNGSQKLKRFDSLKAVIKYRIELKP
jgi:hypothetical protein